MNEDAFFTGVRRLLEENLTSGRWCQNHLQDREVAFRLRKIALSASALALALDYKMDGREAEALHALKYSDLSPQEFRFDPRFQGHG
jgi:hypothetical protein